MSVPARPASVRRVREALLAWLPTVSWPVDHRDPLVFAVAESVTNSIEHAYPAGAGDHEVTVLAHEQTDDGRRRVIAAVTDRGTWQPANDSQQRGLMLMRAFAESVRIERSAQGTTVTITSNPVGLAAAAPSR